MCATHLNSLFKVYLVTYSLIKKIMLLTWTQVICCLPFDYQDGVTSCFSGGVFYIDSDFKTILINELLPIPKQTLS